MFGVPNAFLLSIFASIVGILPIIGPMIVWLPVLFYLLVVGNVAAAIGILIFGLLASNVDHIIRPLFISKMAKVSPAIALIGMIGGVFLFGILGIVLGPLILSYLLIILEVLKDNRSSKGFSFLIRED